ncbi:MAG: DUF5667 domain-containing protein [Streptosporangiaceae bacterium]
MRVWPGTRRRERLARLLEGDASARDPELARLADIASGLRALPRGKQGPAHRAAIRDRLVAEARVPAQRRESAENARPAPSTVRSRPPARRAGPSPLARHIQRRFVVLSGALSIIVMVVGAAVAADRSVPGDPFYELKRTAESTQLVLASSQVARGRQQLRFASARLSEIKAMTTRHERHGQAAAQNGSARLVTHALADMDTETRGGAATLLGAYRGSADIAPLTLIDAFSRAQASELSAIVPRLPEVARPRGRESLALLHRIDARVTDLLESACRAGAGCASVLRASAPAQAAPTASPTGSPTGHEGQATPPHRSPTERPRTGPSSGSPQRHPAVPPAESASARTGEARSEPPATSVPGPPGLPRHPSPSPPAAEPSPRPSPTRPRLPLLPHDLRKPLSSPGVDGFLPDGTANSETRDSGAP